MKGETRTLSSVVMNVREIKSRGDSGRGGERGSLSMRGGGSIFADHFVIGGNDSFLLLLCSFFSLSSGRPARPVPRSYFQLERELTFHSREAIAPEKEGKVRPLVPVATVAVVVLVRWYFY